MIIVLFCANEIGTQTMSYLELAVNDLTSLKDFDSCIIDLQNILDHILAFWASLDDEIENYEIRNIIKLGRRLERLDMYLYLHKDMHELVKALRYARTSLGLLSYSL